MFEFVYESVCVVCVCFMSFMSVCAYGPIHRVSKNCANLFLLELRQISINFDNVWQKDGKEAKIMRDALIFHLNEFASPHYRVKRKCSKLLHNAAIISIRLLTFAS